MEIYFLFMEVQSSLLWPDNSSPKSGSFQYCKVKKKKTKKQTPFIL